MTKLRKDTMDPRRRPKVFAGMATFLFAAGLLIVPTPLGAVAAPNLGQESLKILVGGVALYPHPLLSTILEASSHPLQIKAALEGGAPAGRVASPCPF